MPRGENPHSTSGMTARRWSSQEAFEFLGNPGNSYEEFVGNFTVPRPIGKMDKRSFKHPPQKARKESKNRPAQDVLGHTSDGSTTSPVKNENETQQFLAAIMGTPLWPCMGCPAQALVCD